MTNEEARELLQLDRKAYTIASPLELCLRTSQHVLFDNEEDKLREAIEMAIKALEQEPCEDAISRQAAIDAIENEQKKIMRSDWAIDQAKFSAMSEIRELIAELPPVSTEKTESEDVEGD